MAAFEAVVKQLGFLTDRQIAAGLAEGHLLEMALGKGATCAMQATRSDWEMKFVCAALELVQPQQQRSSLSFS